MAVSTIFPVIDYLVATIRALPECSSPVAVYDGFPDMDRPPVLVTIGGSVEPTVEDTETWAALGAKGREEDYSVNCYISSYVGGTSADQKSARDAAKTVFNAIDAALRADPTLGGNVLIGGIDVVRLQQTDESTASEGRVAEIHFTVRCMARI